MPYTVTWEFTVDDDQASSHEEAAIYARQQQYPGTLASVFVVVDDNGVETDVDVEDVDPLINEWEKVHDY